MNSGPKIRTIKQAIAEIKAFDSETAFTERALRRIIHEGKIPAVYAGNKTLIDMNNLYAYLTGVNLE